MKTPVYFISDIHLKLHASPKEKKRRGSLYRLLDQIRKTGGSCFFVGDLFDFYFEYPHLIPKAYMDFYQKAVEMKNDGIELHLLLGNHDYWDFGFFNRTFSKKSFKNQFKFKKHDQNCLIIHGDGILKEDYGYRLFRRIIRSKLCIFLYNLLSPRIGYLIAKKISKADKPKEYYKDNELIKKKLLSYAKEKWKEVDVLLIGHYHQDGIIEEGNKKLIFLGDWLNKYLVTKYENGVWEQIKWNK